MLRRHAGDWLVRRAHKEFHGSGGTRDRNSRLGFPPIEWNCEVHHGKTTMFDLELTSATRPYAVRGRLQIDGACKGRWTASVVYGDNFMAIQWGRPRAKLDPDGGFTVDAKLVGKAHLVLINSSVPRPRQFVSCPITIGRDMPRIELSFTTATLEFRGLTGGAGIPATSHLHEGTDGLVCVTAASADEDGVALLVGVPAGKGMIVRTDMFEDPKSWEALDGVTVQASKKST